MLILGDILNFILKYWKPITLILVLLIGGLYIRNQIVSRDIEIEQIKNQQAIESDMKLTNINAQIKEIETNMNTVINKNYSNLNTNQLEKELIEKARKLNFNR